MVEIRLLKDPEPELLYPLIQQLNPKLSYNEYHRYFCNMLACGYFVLAAFEDEEIIGITGCWRGAKFYCGKFIEIDNFVVDKKVRGKGIGEKILQAVMDLAKKEECDTVLLNAYAWNDGAHRFYDRHGFEAPGIHRVYWLNKAMQKTYSETMSPSSSEESEEDSVLA